MNCTNSPATLPAVDTTVSITDPEAVARYNSVDVSAVPETATIAAQDSHRTHGTTSGGLFVWAGQVE